jgi:hypothetical protein
MRVLGYARRSEGEAGIDEFEFGGQRRRMEQACTERGWTLVDVFEEVSDVAAPVGRRKALRDAVTEVADGEAEVLLVTRADRIGLGIHDFRFLARLVENGRRFVALDADWDTSTPEGAGAARIFAHLAEGAGWLATGWQRPSWDGRNALLVKHIRPGSSVLDLGSGAQTLRGLLPAGCDYQPCDVVDSGPGVLRCDFNRDIWPRVTTRPDVVVVSGVMEYLEQPRDFLARVVTLGDRILLTHAFRPEGQVAQGRMWKTHLTQPELEALFTELRLRWRLLDSWHQTHGIYALRAPRAPASEIGERIDEPIGGELQIDRRVDPPGQTLVDHREA